MFCIQCGQKLETDSEFCFTCGAKAPVQDETSADEVFCIKCGQKLTSESEFCFTCGAKIVTENELQEDEPAPAPVVEPAAPAEPMVAVQPEPVQVVPEQTQEKTTQPAPAQRGLIVMLICVSFALVVAIVVIMFVLFAGGDDGDETGDYNGGTNGQHGQQAPPHTQQQNQDTAPDVLEGSAYYLNMVRTGRLSAHAESAEPIGVAFDQFFTNTVWDHFSAGEGDALVNYVNFTGHMMQDGEEIKVQMIMQVWPELDIIEVIMMNFVTTEQSQPQDIPVMHALLSEIFG